MESSDTRQITRSLQQGVDGSTGRDSYAGAAGAYVIEQSYLDRGMEVAADGVRKGEGDSISTRYKISSNRPNDTTRMWWLGRSEGRMP